MSTPQSFTYLTLQGPSRMDLNLALFNRKRPEPLMFIAHDKGRKVEIRVWLKGLIQTEENSWKLVGTLTADSLLNPSGGIGPSLRFVCHYNDHTRAGVLSSDGMDEVA